MNKNILLLTLFGISVGLLTGILDSLFQYLGFDNNRYVSIFVYIILFTGIYMSVRIYRNKILNGFIDLKEAYRRSFTIGVVASFTLAILRFFYLKFIAVTDMETILSKTQQNMINHSDSYKDDMISNRLSFIEFSYDPLVSSTFYFFYYTIIVLFLAFLAAILLRKIDRDISLQ